MDIYNIYSKEGLCLFVCREASEDSNAAYQSDAGGAVRIVLGLWCRLLRWGLRLRCRVIMVGYRHVIICEQIHFYRERAGSGARGARRQAGAGRARTQKARSLVAALSAARLAFGK